ncbi:MAG TPA: hypothetical protein VLK29_13325 [Luteimonas sp.]|nr:hypothetical protein [Luteimonas sp.]
MFAGTGMGAVSASELLTGSVPDIVAQQLEIRRDLQAERRGWDQVTLRERATVIENQQIVFDLLRDRSSMDELNPREQVSVMNALETIRTIAKDAKGDRKICTRERATGSNHPVRVCRTAEQIARERAASREGMDQASQLSRQPRRLNGP